MSIEREIQKLIETNGTRENRPTEDGLAYARHRNPLLVAVGQENANQCLVELAQAWNGSAEKPRVLPLRQLSMATLPMGDDVLRVAFLAPFAALLRSFEDRASASVKKAMSLHEKLTEAFLAKENYHKERSIFPHPVKPENSKKPETSEVSEKPEASKKEDEKLADKIILATNAMYLIDEFFAAMRQVIWEMHGVQDALFLLTVSDIQHWILIEGIYQQAFVVGHPSLYVMVTPTDKEWRDIQSFEHPEMKKNFSIISPTAKNEV